MLREFRINNFDILRLLAATQVLIVHSCYHLNLSSNYFKFFYPFQGVPIFFVISGYLISSSFEKSNDLKNYFRNRILRIYPGLWGCLIVTIITAAVFGGINFINPGTIPWLLAQMAGIIYTPNILKNYGFGSYNGALWTIPIELQFYILLPVVYFLKDKLKSNYFFTILWLLFFLIAFFFKLYFSIEEPETIIKKLLRYSFLPDFWLFLTGVILQRAKVYKSNLIYGKGLIWLCAYILFSLLVPYTTILSLFSMFFLGITAISLAYTFPSFSNKLFKGNDISYGVYIYHGIVVNIFVQLSFIHRNNYLLYVLLITYILAFISWKLIEKPFISKKAKTIHSINVEAYSKTEHIK